VLKCSLKLCKQNTINLPKTVHNRYEMDRQSVVIMHTKSNGLYSYAVHSQIICCPLQYCLPQCY